MTTPTTKAPERITVQLDEKDREIMMSFGLLSELARLIGSPELVSQVYIDLDKRDQILGALVAERKKSGKLVKEGDIEEMDISTEDAAKLLDWAMEHVMLFFVASLKRVTELSMRHQPAMQEVASSLNGPAA